MVSPSKVNNLNVWIDKEVLRAVDHLRIELGMNRKALVELLLRGSVEALKNGDWSVEELQREYDLWVKARSRDDGSQKLA